MPVLEVQGLVKSYGRRRVVDGVDFAVDRGEIVGLLGPNGAGKTTCFRMTCGMTEPQAGHVMLDGVDVPWLTLGRGLLSHNVTFPQQTMEVPKQRRNTPVFRPAPG